MNRRDSILALIAVGAAPFARAQPAAKAAVIGLLDAGERLEWWTVFREQMRSLGYVEGRNVAFEARYAGGKIERLETLAQELVRLKVALIVTSGTVAAQIAKKTTSVIPIVMATGDDPVRIGLAASLARPGGNATGMTSIASGLAGKRFELLREVLPKVSRLAVLWHSENPTSTLAVRELEAAAGPAKIPLLNVAIKSAAEIPAAFAAMAHDHARAVFVVHGPLIYSERRTISELALKYRLPAIYGATEYAEAGGLLSYAPDYHNLFRGAAVYVDKILKGAKPGDLPIEQPTKFELVINRRTAKTLGLTIPQTLLARADRMIE